VPILAVTRDFMASRICHLYRGVYPFFYDKPRPTVRDSWQDDVDARIRWVVQQAVSLELIQPGDFVVAIQGWTSGHNHSNTLRVILLPHEYSAIS